MLHCTSLFCAVLYSTTLYRGNDEDVLVRVRGGISFLKTVNTLQVALQKHKGGDGPSKHEVHLQRCQESPREHMPHNRGISGHRRYPPKAHLDSLGCRLGLGLGLVWVRVRVRVKWGAGCLIRVHSRVGHFTPGPTLRVRVRVRVRVQIHQHGTQGHRTSA